MTPAPADPSERLDRPGSDCRSAQGPESRTRSIPG